MPLCLTHGNLLPWSVHELLPLDSNVRAKLTIMLKIKKSQNPFCHILETLNKNYEKKLE